MYLLTLMMDNEDGSLPRVHMEGTSPNRKQYRGITYLMRKTFCP
jgi:hypothetical protein